MATKHFAVHNIRFEILLLAAILISAPVALAQSAGYHRDVEPILRMHCVSCHTEHSEWWPADNTKHVNYSSYAKTMSGSDLGPIVVPGQPDSSLLYQVILPSKSDLRMPFLGAPLSEDEISTIRRWIAEGAKEDSYAPPYREITLPQVDLGAGLVRVMCRVLSPAYLELDVLDGTTVVESHEAVINRPKDYADAGKPGSLATWILRSSSLTKLSTPTEAGFTVRLRVYPQDNAYTPTVFFLDSEDKINLFRQAGSLVDIIPNPLELPNRTSAAIKFWLDYQADVSVSIFAEKGKRALSRETLPDLGKGLNYYNWKVPSGDIAPGRYSAILHETDPRTGKHILSIAADFIISLSVSH